MTAAARVWTSSLLAGAFLLGCDRSLDPTGPSFAKRGGGSPSLTATAVATNQIDLEWEDNSKNVTRYEIYRSTTGENGTFTLLAATSASVKTFSDAGLLSSNEYCYKVRSSKTSGVRTSNSEFSPAACATTLSPPPGPPTAPSGVGASPFPDAVWIDWSDNSSNETGFRIERSADGSTWEVFATVVTYEGWPGWNRKEAWIQTENRPEEEVCYRVIAFNADGESEPSAPGCTVLPAAPSELTLTMLDDTTFDLAWVDNSNAEDGFMLWLAACPGEWWDVYWLPANTTGVRLTTADLAAVLGPADGWFLEVRALRGGGHSAFSNQVEVGTVGEGTSCMNGW